MPCSQYATDSEAFDIKAGYTNPSLFKRHKMHLIYSSTITMNDNDLAIYREFIEDVRIIEMSYDKEENRLKHVEYTNHFNTPDRVAALLRQRCNNCA